VCVFSFEQINDDDDDDDDDDHKKYMRRPRGGGGIAEWPPLYATALNPALNCKLQFATQLGVAERHISLGVEKIPVELDELKQQCMDATV